MCMIMNLVCSFFIIDFTCILFNSYKVFMRMKMFMLLGKLSGISSRCLDIMFSTHSDIYGFSCGIISNCM